MIPIASCFCWGERGAGGALAAAAGPPAVRAGAGALHLRLFLEAGFAPRSICLGRKCLPPQKGACLPEGRGLYLPASSPPRKLDLGSTTKCCWEN